MSHFRSIARMGANLLGMVAALSLGAGTAYANTDPRSFEGTWRDAPTNNPFKLRDDIPHTAESRRISEERWAAFRAGATIANAHLTCRPTGVQGFTAPKGPVLAVQTDDQLVFISQEDREVRIIHLNQTEHPKNLTPTYSGHSIGRWEGNTLVIDTVGFNSRGLLDEAGDVHSDQLHLVERLTKSPDGKTLTNELTITDPVYYTETFTVTRVWHSNPGVKLLDYDCSENPRADLFEVMSFPDDWFKPTCVRPVENGMASEEVVCTPQRSGQGE